MTILIIIAIIIALFFIVAYLSKRGYSLEREITIDKPAHEVFSYLKHIRNQDFFNKWVMMDPAMKKEFRGTDGTIGFIYAWDGNKQAGAGEQEIKNITEDKKLDIEVRFTRPFAGIAYTPFTTQAISPNQTKVKWGMSSEMKYPMNIMLLFMNMDKMLGNDIQTSLTTLKKLLEAPGKN